MRVERLDEIPIQAIPQQAHVGAVLAQARALRDDRLTEVQVDEPGRGQRGGADREGSVEAALVVVVAVTRRVVFAADVDDRMACGEEGGVARAQDGAGVVLGELAQEVHG